MKSNKFSKFVNIVLIYNIGVILWGAYVRATGSGAGCGSHWPLCNGVVLPRSPQIETIVEFFHRITSGVSFILVFVLFLFARRKYKKGSLVLKGASLSFIFIITEALLGAGLVLFQWVANDVSIGRSISIVVHLVNTFLLLAFLALTSWWASGGGRLTIKFDRLLHWGLFVSLVGTLVLGASGALTALGDTLFPATSLAEGIRQDFSTTAHFLIRFRILHPSIAILTGVLIILVSGYSRLKVKSKATYTWSRIVTVLVLTQLLAGMVNVLLLAPNWMQILHLLLADTLWISLIYLTASVLAEKTMLVEGRDDYIVTGRSHLESTN